MAGRSYGIGLPTRSFGAVLVSPTATGNTWALMGDDADTPNLARILEFVRGRWNIDPITTAAVSTIATAASTHSAAGCSRASVMDRPAVARCRGGCGSGPLPIPSRLAALPHGPLTGQAGQGGEALVDQAGQVLAGLADPALVGGLEAGQGDLEDQQRLLSVEPRSTSRAAMARSQRRVLAIRRAWTAGVGDQPLAGQAPFRVGHAVGG